jgi:hypothetical protein
MTGDPLFTRPLLVPSCASASPLRLSRSSFDQARRLKELEQENAKLKRLGIGVDPGELGMMGAMLSITGIFGMAAYSVSKRLKELGIRVAV